MSHARIVYPGSPGKSQTLPEAAYVESDDEVKLRSMPRTKLALAIRTAMIHMAMMQK